jgi:hypothetical protein
MIGRADIQGSKGNVAMSAWLPQASYPCGNFSDKATIRESHQLPGKRPFKVPYLPDSLEMKMRTIWRNMHLFAAVKIGYNTGIGTQEELIQTSAAIVSLTTGIGFYHSSLATSLVERRMAFCLIIAMMMVNCWSHTLWSQFYLPQHC